MNQHGLVYVGKIVSLEPIPGADFIVSAIVFCGKGGEWKGIVRKSEFHLGSHCIVFLPDSLLDPEIHTYLPFMKDSNWRVRMRRFKGAPSEVLIIPIRFAEALTSVGHDVTQQYQVTKYQKPIPVHLQGIAKGDFPSFIPKTDEPNYQNEEGRLGVEKLIGNPFYVTEKADGSSTTAFRYKGQFGVCSRNLELERDENNGYWQIAIRHKLEDVLHEGIAIQWETCGPKIQGNPMGWQEIQGLLFSAYNIYEKRYLEFAELCQLSEDIGFPMVMVLKSHPCFSPDGIELLGEGTYSNGNPREGVVVRSMTNLLGHKPISFKVINLGYEK